MIKVKMLPPSPITHTMSNQEISFEHLNSLILKPPAHRILHLRPGQKNLQLKFIVLELLESIRTKKGTIYKFLVADETASGEMNIYDEVGAALGEGDVCYMSGGYASVFKERLVVYQGKQAIFKRLGRAMMYFESGVNVSSQPVEQE